MGRSRQRPDAMAAPSQAPCPAALSGPTTPPPHNRRGAATPAPYCWPQIVAAGLSEYRPFWDGETPVADTAGVSKTATKDRQASNHERYRVARYAFPGV